MNNNNNICKWYNCCPIKFFVEDGKLDFKWVENYCLVSNRECIRFQKEENNEKHPDNMLPDGTIKDDLV